MIIKAGDFQSRDDLERYIKAEIGITAIKSDHLIRGTREELKQLRLSDTATVYGIMCQITDNPTKNIKGNKKIHVGR